MRSLVQVPGCCDSTASPPAEGGATEPAVHWEGLTCAFVFHSDPARLFEEIGQRYVNLLVLDLRCEDGRLGDQAARAMALLDALDRKEDVEHRYAFHRILALVPDAPTTEVDDVIRTLGASGVGHVLRDVSHGPAPEAAGGWAHRFIETACRILRDRRPGKLALCAAGGGITGIFFELGTLKCFDDCLGGAAVNGFDMYFGISAGAVVCGPLAVGYSVDEFLAAIEVEID